MKKYIWILLMMIMACQPPAHEGILSLNQLDFSNYIAIGSDYTAGYADDGLFAAAQASSFPQILMNQVKLTQEGGSLFFQLPLLQEGLDRHYHLTDFSMGNCNDKHVNYTLGYSQYDSSSLWYTLNLSQRYNNMGIPHLRVSDLQKSELATPEGFVNVYFDRMQASPTNRINYQTYIQILEPTFFTVELGFNDVWWYVWKGWGELTPVDSFEQNYRNILSAARTNPNAKGLLFTIPNVEDLPFVNYIGHQWEYDSTCATLPIYVKEASGSVRALVAGEYVTLKGYEEKVKFGIGSDPISSFLSDTLVISKSEASKLQQYITQYNTIIYQLADEFGLAVMDMNSLCRDLRQNRITINGVNINSSYLMGGFYSIDGWTTTPRGNALLAYYAIKAINAKYQATIPLPNVTDYEGVKFP